MQTATLPYESVMPAASVGPIAVFDRILAEASSRAAAIRHERDDEPELICGGFPRFVRTPGFTGALLEADAPLIIWRTGL